MTTMNKQWHPGVAPDGRAHARQLQAGRGAGARAAGRPGAGAQPLHVARPVHARAHERRARATPQPQPLNAVMHGGTVGEVVALEEPGLPGRRQGGRRGRLAAVRSSTRRRRQLRKVDTRRVPLSAYLGAVGMPGVTAWVGLMTDHRAQGRRDGGGLRRQRRGRRGGRPARQGAGLPRRRHRRRAGEVQRRGRRIRLRRLRRLQGRHRT